jgi:transcriptional regulator with XRE-family HTH domain
MKMNTDRNWLLTKAEQEDGCMVSVGGLVTALEGKTQAPDNVIPLKVAFSRFLLLARRERKLSLERFAEATDVDLAELLKIEAAEHYVPSPRTVHQVASFLKVPARKLMALAGLLQVKDAQFQNESLRFAARSEPVETLSPEEHSVYEEYVKFLCER